MQRPPFVTTAIARRREFSELTIVHVSDDLRTRAALSADDVKRIADEYVLTTDVWIINEVATAFARTAIVESPGHIDARWIITFRDAAERDRLTIAIDRFGRRAIVEGRPVAIDGAALVRLVRQVMTAR
jgi:hypothetical protein